LGAGFALAGLAGAAAGAAATGAGAAATGTVVGGSVSRTVDGVVGTPVVGMSAGSTVVVVPTSVLGGFAVEATGRLAAAIIDVSPKMPDAVRPVAMMRAPAATCGCLPRGRSTVRVGCVATSGTAAWGVLACCWTEGRMGCPAGGAHEVDECAAVFVGIAAGAWPRRARTAAMRAA
jgi:hypothetical protein